MIEAIIIVFAVTALLSIALEEFTHINKAKTTLFFGCVSWVLLFIHAKHTGSTEHIQHTLNENWLEIATLWLFLMATMTFVAYLNARGLISTAVSRIMPQQVTMRGLTVLLGVFAALLSMLCDNITATLVALGVIQAFHLETLERVKLAVLVVFAVNSGGVILITGDVTTLMIFSAGYVSIAELLELALPTLAGVAALTAIFCFGNNRTVHANPSSGQFAPLDSLIALLFFATIIATMALNIAYGIPPVLTFLTGLSIMFLLGGLVHKYHHEIHLLEYIRQIQFDTLLFFLGILLIVGALKEIGVLVSITEFYFKASPEISNFVVGVLSSVLDNVPLTAALIQAEPTLTDSQWLGLTYAVGVGGSLLVIGSAAGIIAMSKIKELTFLGYAKFIPHLLVAYGVGYGLAVLMTN